MLATPRRVRAALFNAVTCFLLNAILMYAILALNAAFSPGSQRCTAHTHLSRRAARSTHCSD